VNNRTSKQTCGVCGEHRRAARAVVLSSHQAFLLLMEAIDSFDDSRVDLLMRSAAEGGKAKEEILNAYMKHLQTHCVKSDEDDHDEDELVLVTR
jgi:hypothetical protein